jgi:hypothetical protein
MRFLDIQGRIDAKWGKIQLPTGIWKPEFPVFVDSETELIGPDRQSIVSGALCGTPFISGWRRDRLNTSHLASNLSGVRTKDEVHIWSKGTSWDLGPEIVGWPATKRLIGKMSFTLVGPVPPWMPLFGISTDEWQITNGWGLCPSPFVAWWEPGRWCVALRTQEADNPDGLVRVFKTTNATIHPQTNVPIDFMFAANMNTGEVIIEVNKTRFSVSYAESGPNWGVPGTKLRRNYMGSYGAGQIDPFIASDEWGTQRYDAIIHSLMVEAERYDGKPTLTCSSACRPLVNEKYPLITGSSNEGCKHLMVVHKDNRHDLMNNVTLNNVRVHAGRGHAGFTGGRFQGNPWGLMIRDSEFYFGTRAIQLANFGVCYPLHIVDTWAHHQSDSHYELWNVSDGTITRSPIEYCGVSAMRLYNCGINIGRHLYTPTDFPDPLEPVFYIRGGSTWLDGCNGDQEFSNVSPIAFIQHEIDQLDQRWHRHMLKVSNCTVGQMPGGATQPPLVLVGRIPSTKIMVNKPCIIIEQGDERERKVRFRNGADIPQVEIIGTSDVASL